LTTRRAYTREAVQKLDSAEDAGRLLEQRPEKTTTYQVSKEILDQLPHEESAGKLRATTEEEDRELAAYLGVEVSELDRPFSVVDAKCQNCERQISFLDFAQTAVDTGAHDKEMLATILTGRGGAWLTIRGLDGGRDVICINCGKVALEPGLPEYGNGEYRYA
jgi:hypothetical protein